MLKDSIPKPGAASALISFGAAAALDSAGCFRRLAGERDPERFAISAACRPIWAVAGETYQSRADQVKKGTGPAASWRCDPASQPSERS